MGNASIGFRHRNAGGRPRVPLDSGGLGWPMRSRSAPSNVPIDQRPRSAAGAARGAYERGAAEVVGEPTQPQSTEQSSTIVAGEAGWRRLVPLVRLLARQAAAETIGKCCTQNTPAPEEPTQ